MKKSTILYVTGILLCFLIASPRVLAVISQNFKPIDPNTVINVYTETTAKTIEVGSMKFPARQTMKIETFANGSKKATISVNMTIGNGGICITMETMLSTEKKKSTTMHDVEYSTQTSGLYPYVDTWDYLHFLLPGSNGTCFVSYPHDNNYDQRGYYPSYWYLSYALPNKDYPEPRAQKSHIHLTKDFLEDWYNGVIDSTTAHGIILGIGGGILTVLGGILSCFFENPWIALATIGAGISSIIGAILSFSGMSEADWIRDVVTEQFSGDGWKWEWGFKTLRSEGFIVDPPILDIYSYNDVFIHLQHHRVGILCWESVEFYQSWGADRNPPQKITIVVRNLEYVNPGLFACSPEDYGFRW